MKDSLAYCLEYDHILEEKIRKGFGNIIVTASLRSNPKLISGARK